MTFAARTLAGTGGGPQSADYSDNDFSNFGQAVSGINFNSNGTVTLVSSGANTTNWFSPTISGIGSSYWIYIAGSGFTAGNTNSTLSLSSAKFVNCSTTGSGIIRTASAFGSYTIYNAASAGAIVAAGTITLQSEYDGT